MNSPQGLIFDIQAHSVHDGPGTRTLVFMSGCPLRCKWCSNPEGLLLRQRLMYKAQLCHCPFRCVKACTKTGAKWSDDGSPRVLFDRSICDHCESMDCTKVCYQQALQTSGKWYTVDDLMKIFNRDRCYWGPEGGITLSGGEPLMQREFVVELLRRCHDAYITACLETTLCVPRETVKAVLPYVQWMFVDIKHMDSIRHEQGTGVSNDLILGNIRWLQSSGWPGRIVIRMPAIPGFNDALENAEATAAFLNEVGLREINLLPFHRLGASKYEQLGMHYEYAEQEAIAPESLEALASIYRSHSIACHLGADTPF